MNDSCLALRGSSVESFSFKISPTVNRDNREVVLSDLPCVLVNVNSSYIKSLAVDKLYWRRRRQNLSDSSRWLSDWFRLGGLSAAAAADGGGSGDY